MAESNSQPTRCPCGFFGSAQTLGLCSKCYREREQNRDQQLTADASRSSNHVSTAADMINASIVMQLQQESLNSRSSSSELRVLPAGGSSSESRVLPAGGSSSESRVLPAGDSSSESRVLPADGSMEPTPESDNKDNATCDETTEHPRGVKRKRDELDDGDEDTQSSGDNVPMPVQKNKKRCFTCNCRLDLAIQAIGKCKCEYVFCPLHRLPEQHDCMFDHKENSRQEARAKMVVFKKHVGTALKRLDSDS